MPMPQVPDEMHGEVAFAISCYLDDYEKEIKRTEKSSGKKQDMARQKHARLQKWLLTEFNSSALCGRLVLMNGEIIAP